MFGFRPQRPPALACACSFSAAAPPRPAPQGVRLQSRRTSWQNPSWRSDTGAALAAEARGRAAHPGRTLLGGVIPYSVRERLRCRALRSASTIPPASSASDGGGSTAGWTCSAAAAQQRGASAASERAAATATTPTSAAACRSRRCFHRGRPRQPLRSRQQTRPPLQHLQQQQHHRRQQQPGADGYQSRSPRQLLPHARQLNARSLPPVARPSRSRAAVPSLPTGG